MWKSSASQPESESLVSEEEDEEEEDEESEEELLALRREGWVCGSVAGFSAGKSKTHPIRTTRHKKSIFFCFNKIFSTHDCQCIQTNLMY